MTAEHGPPPGGRDHYPTIGYCAICLQNKTTTYGPFGTAWHGDTPSTGLLRICADCIREILAGRPPHQG